MIDDKAPMTIDPHPEAATDLGAALREFEDAIKKDINICFPVCIYSYDRTTHKATVMPLVKQGFFNGAWHYIRRKPIENVTVRNIQCGGFTIDFPVYVGDTGWLFSSDRDPILVKQEGALTNSVLAKDRPINIVEDDYQQDPNTLQVHTFLGGFFIPDNWGGWDSHRYKDDHDISVGSALYIGSSFDTDDQRADTTGKSFQHGDAYEKKTSASLVIQKGGRISLASSSDKETNQNCHVWAEKNRVEMKAANLGNEHSAALSIDSEEGIIIRQDEADGNRHFSCSIQSGKFLLRMIDGQSSMNFYFSDGKLNLSTSSDMNMQVGGTTNFKCSGDVNLSSQGNLNVHSESEINVNTSKDAYVAAENIRAVAKETASVAAKNVSAAAVEKINVNAGDTVNIGAAKTTNINGGEKINLAAGKRINVTAPDAVEIVTASNATIMAKQKGATISVKTLSKDSTIDITTEGKNTQMQVKMMEEKSNLIVELQKKDSQISLRTEEENSPIYIDTNGKKSPIEISTNGDESDIKIASNSASIDVQAAKELRLTAGESANITAPEIKLNGGVAIEGSLNLNGNGFSPAEHEKDIKYWAHD